MAALPTAQVEDTDTPALRWLSDLGTERLIAYFVLLISVCFSAFYLVPEATIKVQPLNDNVLHIAAARQAAKSLAAGHDPTNSWLPQIGFGYPLFVHYQHLEYIPVAAVNVLTRNAISIPALIHWSTVLLLSLFPLSMFWAMRQVGFGHLAAGFGGMAAPLIATNGLYGFDFASYVWRGFGLYTQVWGMFLLPLALAFGYRLLREGRGYFPATLFLVTTLLCHTVYGYMALLALAAIALLLVFDHSIESSGIRLWSIARRLVLLFGLTALAGSYFLVPFILDGAYMNRSVWELPSKYNSFGASWVMSSLGKGDLFDYGRLPVLTLLAGIGLIVCVVRWREPLYRLPVALFALWLALYFGRPTWGSLLNVLPLSSEMQFHRLIGGVHLAGLLLIGVALAAPWPWLLRQPRIWPAVCVGILCAGILFPAYRERAHYLTVNAELMRQTQTAFAEDQTDLNALTSALRALPPGRVYAGFAGGWGNSYRVGSIPMYTYLQNEGFDMVGYLYDALSLNSDVEVWFDDTRQYEYNLYNVRYVVAPVGRTFPSFVKPVARFGPNELYQVDTTGYFDLVQTTVALVGNKNQFYPPAESWLKGAEPALKQEPQVILKGKAPSGSAMLPLAQSALIIARAAAPVNPPKGAILSETVGSSGSYAATVRADEATTVMVKVTFHPGWRITVDGVPVKPIMLMPSFIGIPVTAGTHHIQLIYSPGSLRLWLQILGIVTLAGTVVVDRKRKDVDRGIDWIGRQVDRMGLPWISSHTSKTSTDSSSIVAPAQTDARKVELTSAASRERAIVLTRISIARTDLTPRTVHTATVDRAVPVDSSTRVTRRLSPLAPKMETKFDPKPGWRPVDKRVKLGIYLLFFSVYLVTGPGHFYTTDHVAVYLTTQSMVEHHSLAIAPIARTVVGRGGKTYGRYGLLQSVVSIPLYLVGKAVDSVASPQMHALLAGPNLQEWGGTVPIFFVSLLNAFITPFTCLLVFLFALRLGFNTRVAFGTMLLFGFSTLAWTYARDYFQHPLETLLLFLAAYLLFIHRDRLTVNDALMAGVPLGFAVLTRLNIAVVIPVFAIYVFLLASQEEIVPIGDGDESTGLFSRIKSRLKRPITGVAIEDWSSVNAVRVTAAFVATPILSVLLYFGLNYYRFDTIRDPAFSNILDGSLDIFVGLFGNLLSPGRSIFLYSPPLILALLVFRQFYRRFPYEALLVAGIAICYIVLYSIPLDWDGGWSWGPRYLLAIVPFLMLPLGYFFTSKWRIAVTAVFGLLGAGIQLLGIIINYSYVYWDWTNMHLVPSNAFLFVPGLSPIPTNFRDLLAGKNVDMWIVWAYHQSGFMGMLGIIGLAVSIFMCGLFLLLDGFALSTKSNSEPDPSRADYVNE